MNTLELIAYPLLPVSAMELLLGFLLLSQSRRSSPVHRSVAAIAFFSFAYSLNTAVMYLTASRGHDFIFFARLNWIGWLAIPAGLQFLFYLRSETSRIARRIGYLLYPYWAIVLALCLFTDMIVTPGYSLIPYRNDPGPLEVPARLVGALMTLWLIVEIIKTRHHLTGIKKFQLDHFFYGLLIFSFAGIAIAGLMPAIGGSAIEPGLGSYFSLPWVLLTFYAIVRYSLFEMRIIFSRTLSTFILTLACSAVQGALLAALSPAVGTPLAIFISLSLLGFFLFGTPLSRTIQSVVNSLVVGDRYHYETFLREAIVTLNAKMEGQELVDYLVETTCSGLGVRDAGVYLHNIEDGYVMRQASGLLSGMKNRRSLADIAVGKLQETNRSLILTVLTGTGEDPETAALAAYLRGIGAEVLVPLLFQERLQGALVLGAKANGEMFGQSDIGFLEALAAHAAIALENARLNDITRTIRSSLQQSEERFMTLAQRMPAAVFIHRGASIVYANAAAEAMTGYPSRQLITMHMDDIIRAGSGKAAARNGFDTVGLQPQAAGQEVRVLQRSGTERWAVMTSAVIEYGEGAAAIRILFDLTEHKRTEGKLRYERIRSAVARMADTVSRDVEGLIKDLREAAELREEGGDEHRSGPARKIKTTIEQAELLVRTLKELGTRHEAKRTLQDINELVGKRKQLLAAMLAGKCELVMRLKSESLMVMADPIKFESMLMNLVLNARDQMPRGGMVTVATGRAVIDPDFIRQNGYGRVGMYAAVSVSDTGEGLTGAEQERIFEPYFTAEGSSKGNGAGLSIVYDIIKEHEGYITVTSRPGKGCSCTAYFPLQH